MCTTRPPAASIRAAASITSITMNGGTSLRADGVSSRRAALISSPFAGRIESRSPRCCRIPPVPFHKSLARTAFSSELPALIDNLGFFAAPARRICAAALAGILAVTTAGPGRGQIPSGKGLPIIRDAEIEQLLREYMAPILKAAGLAQQNVQVVI